MKHIKQALTLTFIILGASSSHAAVLPKVTLGGTLDTQAGYVSEKNAFKYLNPASTSSGKRNNSGITNDTKVSIEIEGQADAGFKYGGLIKLNADASRDPDDYVGDKTMIFVESSNFGRLEGGANDSAAKKMQISANTIASVPYGIDGFMVKWFSPKNYDGTSYGDRFLKWPELITNCDCISFGNKVTYYTPKLAGFQVGVSYTPDIAVHGTINELRSKTSSENQNYKRLFDYGVTYQNKYNDFETIISFTGQNGKSKAATISRKDLFAYEIGANISYKSFSVGGSYSDWNKSATPTFKDPNKKYGAKYWTAGLGYKYKNLETSLTYYKGQKANVYSSGVPATTAQHDSGYNKNQYISLGASYKAFPGFLPYAELSHFKSRLYGSSVNNKGYVTLFGTRLSF